MIKNQGITISDCYVEWIIFIPVRGYYCMKTKKQSVKDEIVH